MKNIKYFESFRGSNLELKNSTYIIDDENIAVIKVNSFEDMKTLGEDTSWSASVSEYQYKNYSRNGNYFVVVLCFKEEGKNSKFATTIENGEIWKPGFYNKGDAQVTKETVNKILSKYGHSISEITA